MDLLIEGRLARTPSANSPAGLIVQSWCLGSFSNVVGASVPCRLPHTAWVWSAGPMGTHFYRPFQGHRPDASRRLRIWLRRHSNETGDAILERELADPDLALLVRLLGDGLLANALAGTPVHPDRVRSALTRLIVS